ncbi:MAG: tetratricopeptide repeat protein [Acidobacteriota bacterium]
MKKMRKRIWTLTVALTFFLSPSVSLAQDATQADAQETPKYRSKYKARGNVHSVVATLPFSVIYACVTQSFTNLELTINYEDQTLGYVEGGRSRGVSGEIVQVWIDPEANGQYRLEVRNIRLSRMGLLGFAGTKDWSKELLVAIKKELAARPSIAQLQSAVESDPTSIEARRKLIEAYVASLQTNEAADAYRALLARFPASNLDRVNFADLLISRGQADQAIEVLKQAQGADSEITLQLARIYILAERGAEAVELLTPLAQKNPADIKARYQMARAAYLAGDATVSKTSFSSVIEQAPQHPFAEQAKLWLRMLEAGPLKKPMDAKTALSLSELLIKEKLDLLAQRHLESVIGSASGPERDQIVRLLVTIYQSQRRYVDIARLIEPQVEQLKKDKQGELIYHLALAQCGLRNFKPAADYLKAAKKAGYKTPKELENVLRGYQQ